MKRTRISKPRLPRQICADRIEFDVSNDFHPLIRRPDPMIVGLALPEALASSVEPRVRFFRRDPFDVLSGPRRGHFWIDPKMDVIGHHDKGSQLVPAADTVAILDYSSDALRDTGILEPIRTRGGEIQSLVGFNEGSSVSAISNAQWKRAIQPEGNEEGFAVRLNVRQIASVFHETEASTVGEKSQDLFPQAEACVPGD